MSTQIQTFVTAPAPASPVPTVPAQSAATQFRPVKTYVLHPSSKLEKEKVHQIHGVQQPPVSEPMTAPIFTSAVFGRGKKRFPQLEDAIDGKYHRYGEDFVVDLTPLVVDSAHKAEASFTAILDGHGLRGNLSSERIARFLPAILQQYIDQIVSIKIAQNDAEKTRVWNEIFELIEKYHKESCCDCKTIEQCTINQASGHSRIPLPGGTTLNVVLIMKICGRTFIEQANVGDSECVVFDNKTGLARVLSVAHSWDDIKQRQEYLEHCAVLQVTPCEVAFGRFNLINGSSLAVNRGKPIYIFKKNLAELDDASISLFNRYIEAHHRVSVGGSQGLRRDVLVEEGDILHKPHKANPESAHLNWGSTPVYTKGGISYGGCQMWKSVGDDLSKQETHMSCVPSVTSMEVGADEDLSLLTVSDGIADYVYLWKEGEKAREYFSCEPKKPLGQYGVALMNRCFMAKGYKSCVFQTGIRQEWDDISGVIVHITTSKDEEV